ncbi:MAG: autotransporter-associated beta strand protein, partial [Planctomycetaceae bacterium]
SGSGNRYSFNVVPDGDGEVTINVAMAAAQDSFENISLAAALFSFVSDRTAPTVDIVDVSPDPRGADAGIVSIRFDEAVLGLYINDFTLTRDGSDVSLSELNIVGTGDAYELDLSTVTSLAGSYVLSLNAPGSGIEDQSGNPVVNGATDAWTLAASSAEASNGSAAIGDNPGAANVVLTLSLGDGGRSQLQDVINGVAAGEGTTQIDDNTIAFVDELNDVTINGGTGDDTLTIDLRNGNPVPGGRITFNGGDGGGTDSLIIIDANGNPIGLNGNYLPDTADGSAGTLIFDLGGGDTLTIRFTGLEPTEVSGVPAFTFTSPNGSDVIIVDAISGSGGEDAVNVAGSSAGVVFESLTAFNIGDLTIDLGANDSVGGGSGADSLSISSGLDADADLAIGLQDLTIDLGTSSGDTLTVDSIIKISGTLSIDGFETIALNVAALDISNAVTGTNGIDKRGTGTLTLSGASTFTGPSIVTAGTLQVDGSTASGANFTVQSSTSLTGSGTLGGAVSVASGATLSPGVFGPGALGTGALTLSSGSTFDVQIASDTPGDGYDQVSVTGAVNVSGATLEVDDTGFTATGQEQIILIDNDGSDTVTGTFDGLAEGVVFTVGGRLFEITYVGGDGNDVVLLSDVTAPMANIVDVTPDPRSIPAGIVTVNFDEGVSGVDIDNFSLTRNSIDVSLAGISVVQVTSSQYTLDLTSVTGDEGSYLLTLSATGSGIQDKFENLLDVSVSDSFDFTIVAEVRSIELVQTGRDNFQTFTFNRTFSDPVVIAQSPTVSDAAPTVTRLQNVTTTGFEIQLDEWEYLDSVHAAETVGLLVVEAGTTRLADGTLIYAGTASVNHVFAPIDLSAAGFTSAPIVISQSQTKNSPYAIVTRQQHVSSTGFDVRVQRQSLSYGIHPFETVGYVAIQAGTGVSGTAFEAGLTGNTVDENFSSISFTQSFSSTPVFLSSLQTSNDQDLASVRYRNLTTTGVEVRAEEEQSRDMETDHGLETVGFLAFDGNGSLAGLPVTSASTGDSVTLPNGGGSYEVLMEGTDLVVRAVAGAVLLRQDSDSLDSLTITGSADSDQVTLLNVGGAVSQALTFDGLSGADRFDAGTGTGSLILDGGTGNDTLQGGSGHDQITGGDGDDELFGGAGNDVLSGNSGNDTGLGEAGDDSVTGGADSDSLVGGEGNDTVDGQTGNDIVRGGLGVDQLFGGEGDDHLESEEGADTFHGGGGNDTIFGGADDDDLFGDAGNDELHGEDGNDRLFGGGGDDVFIGGTGIDSLIVDLPLGGGSYQVLVDGSDVAIRSEAGAELGRLPNLSTETIEIVGSSQADAIRVIDSLTPVVVNVIVSGNAGADTLDASGSGGGVTLRGGDGDDSLLGSAGDDLLVGGGGRDYLSGAGGNDKAYGRSGADTILGGAGHDSLSGGMGRDELFGDAGDDQLFGNGGADVLRGGEDDDTLRGGSGNDQLAGDAGNDSLLGYAGRDSLIGDVGNDTLRGNAGNDYLQGDEGEDLLSGGGGSDTIAGLAGDDTLLGGGHHDLLVGGTGHDLIVGQGGRDTLIGEAGNDALYGGLSNDIVLGLAGDDTVDAGSGTDNTIAGGEGNDEVFGPTDQVDEAFAFDFSQFLLI